MDELVFPITAALGTFLVLMPALTLAARAALARARDRARAWADFGADTTFAWLVAPTALPLLWLASSALHQVEPAQADTSCLVPHALDTTCADAAILLALLVAGTALAIVRHAHRARLAAPLHLAVATHPAAARVAALVADTPALRGLRVAVAHDAPAPVLTTGWLRCRIVLDACFVRDADDAVLIAALLHERAHVDARDTLRTFVARLAVAINPAGRWLADDLNRWEQAREAVCDGEAVHLGGEPLALAEGIVRAARFACAGPATCGASLLCGHDPLALRLRLALLLDRPARARRTLGHIALLTTVLAALVVPHIQQAGLLEHFHFAVERLLHPGA